MRLIEDFNTVPSLSFLTKSWVVATVWNSSDITRTISRCLSNFDQDEVEIQWEEIKCQVAYIIENIEDISEDSVDEMQAMVAPIGKHILDMLTFIHFSPSFKNFGLRLPVKYWTSYGTVDTKRLEKLLVQDDEIDVAFRYNLACNDCFEKNLEELFPLLTHKQRNNFRCLGENRELLSYWTHRLLDNLPAFVSLTEQYNTYMNDHDYSAHQFAFLYTLLTGNKSGIEYFWNFLTRKEYELVVRNHISFVAVQYCEKAIHAYDLNPRPDTHYEDAMYFLMSKLDEDTRMQILRSDSFCLVAFFRRYPFLGVLSKYAGLLINDLEWNHISWLLFEIIRTEKYEMPSFDLDLFDDLWRACPQSVKADIKNNSLNRLQLMKKSTERGFYNKVNF
ncbi:hypothetical protein TNIN_153761 [Trichonephila inaurata madagascariensis]|uniref:Uncharacterized protein n=1 Tax=Trichonephila inaurata madagascariensis TaxID=2747483 RepID=A0A8X6X5F5_9ARAC|nr:hypothetical protein TNIN_153761 [Trichonephila inaurata madagascariensis]